VFWSSRASRLPGRLLIVAAAALIPAVAGCEAGNNAPTLSWHPPAEGTGTVVHNIAIRNVFVLGGSGTTAIPAGQSAGLYFALVNTGTPDRLMSVQAPGIAKGVTIPGGSVRLATNQVVLLTGPQPRAVLTGLTEPLASGTVVSVVLNFQNAGAVHLRVPVLARNQPYGTFSPAPTPTPTPTATIKVHKHHRRVSPSPSVSGATPTPTSTPAPSTTP
jgi:copper(I)-binding protein